jgi:S1-C subfamily serine protease
VKAGDRLLQLGGRGAILERSAFEAVTRQAPGTKVPVVVERGGERRDVVLTLVRMLGR